MQFIKNLPSTFLLKLGQQLNTFETMNLLMAVERKFDPKELVQSDMYLLVFNQKYTFVTFSLEYS
jgi:hypothetical protein